MRRPQFFLKSMLAVTTILALPCVVLAYGDDVGAILFAGSVLGACIGFVIGKPEAGTALGLLLAFPVWLVVEVVAISLAVMAGVKFD